MTAPSAFGGSPAEDSGGVDASADDPEPYPRAGRGEEKRGLAVLVGVSVLAVAALVAAVIGSDEHRPHERTQTPSVPASAAPAGATVRDGPLTFQVARVASTSTDREQTVVLTLLVTNTGARQADCVVSDQHLRTTDGSRFDGAAAAATPPGPERTIIIDPGEATTWFVSFALAPGASAATLEVHADEGSTGALVTL